MLTRRNLLKTAVSVLVAAAGGAGLWQAWLNRRASARVPLAETPEILKTGQPLMSFFLLSDLHISESDSAMSDKLKMALADISQFAHPVDTLVLGGDLVDGGREGDYRRLRELFSAHQLPPVYANMGNHEYYDIWYNARGDWSKETMPNNKTDAQARERFMRYTGSERPYREAWVNGVHLILLSQETYVQEQPEVGEGAWYSDEQLAWFAETMKVHADGKPAFIFIHQPLPPVGQDGGQHRLIRAKEFRSILQPYHNVFVLSGHTHRNLETEGRYVQESNLHWFSNASVGKTRGGGSVAAPVQGLYVQVHSDQVVLVGREFSNRTWIKAAEWVVKLDKG